VRAPVRLDLGTDAPAFGAGHRAPSYDAIRLHQAEAELERLRGIVRNQEHALRVAGKVLVPYLNRL
jgi:hypothetical protein